MSDKEIIKFCKIVKKIVSSSEFDIMANQRHHIKISVYDHSLKVAYLCYKHVCKYKTNINVKQLIRAALLHDYFLYDRINKTTTCPRNRFIHLFKHPEIALNNANAQYKLSLSEQNAIKRHMFPLIPIPPKTKIGWMICYYDKVAALGDYVSSKKWKEELYIICPDIFKQPIY